MLLIWNTNYQSSAQVWVYPDTLAGPAAAADPQPKDRKRIMDITSTMSWSI